MTGEQVGDGQLSFNVVDSLWVTHHRLPVSTRKSRSVPQCRTSITSFFPRISLFLKCVDILSLNSPISQQHLPAQVHLPPFWNRLPRSPLWNCVNSIVQPLNSISLIEPRWSTWGTRVNAPLVSVLTALKRHCFRMWNGCNRLGRASVIAWFLVCFFHGAWHYSKIFCISYSVIYLATLFSYSWFPQNISVDIKSSCTKTQCLRPFCVMTFTRVCAYHINHSFLEDAHPKFKLAEWAEANFTL